MVPPTSPTGDLMLAHYRALFEQARDIILFVRVRDGQIIEANRAAEQAYGYTRAELLARSITDLRATSTHTHIQRELKQADSAGILFETLHRCKDGRIFPVEVNSLGATIEGERVNLSVIRDTSERNGARQLLEKIFDSLNEVVLVQDPSTRRILHCSPSVERVLGYRPEELAGRTPDCLYARRENEAGFRSRLLTALDRQGHVQWELYLRRKDGRLIFTEACFTEIRDDNDERTAIVISIHDVTRHKEVLKALAESEERFRAITEQNSEGIVLLDEQGCIIEWNQAVERITGIPRQEALGQPVWDVQLRMMPAQARTPAHRAGLKSSMQAALETGESSMFHLPLEVAIQQPDGTTRYIQQTAFPIQTNSGTRIGSLIRDVTRPKLAEKALQEHERQLEQIIQQMPFPVEIVDVSGTALSVNRAFLEMYRIPSADLVVGQFNVFSDPMLASTGLLERLKPAFQGETVFLPEIEVRLPQLDPQYQSSGEDIRCHDITAFPVLNEAGEVWRVVTIWKDVSERRASRHGLQRRLAELEALHAVAQAGTEAVGVDDLIQRVTAIIHDQFYPENFGIALYDEESGKLVFHPSSFFMEGNPQVELTLDEGICGAVARSKQPRRVSDVRQNPDYSCSNPSIRSELCVPVLIGPRLIGVMNVEKVEANAFSLADERLLTAVAGELGTAIEKIRLLEAEQNRRRELEALTRVSAAVREAETMDELLPLVLENIGEVLDVQGAAIAFQDPKDGALVFQLGTREWAQIRGIRMPAGAGVGNQVMLSGQFYLSSDAWKDPMLFRKDFIGSVKSLLCLPLISKGRVVGLMYLGREAAYPPSEVHLAQATADIAASAIHRVRLREQTEQQMERLTALRAIDRMILTSRNIDHTLEVLLDQITGVLQVDAADIMLLDPHSQMLRLSSSRGLPFTPPQGLLVPSEDSFAGPAVLNLELVFIPDVQEMLPELPESVRPLFAPFASYLTIPLIAKERVNGVLHLFSRKKLDPSPDWFSFLHMLAGQAAIAIENAQLLEEQQTNNRRLLEAYDSTIEGWSRALELRDQETDGHSRRVTDLTLKLAERLGLPSDQLAQIRRGAQLHDIGKMGIPDEILFKPGPLNEAEWEIMRKHPVFAVNFLNSIEFLKPSLEIPHYHHEKWDGSGYPEGLKGEAIPLPARIFAVVDVWDALTSDRPYRPAWSKEKTLEYMREQSGRHFDPTILQEFFSLIA